MVCYVQCTYTMTKKHSYLTTELCHINSTKPKDDILEQSVAEGLHFMLKNTRSSCDVILQNIHIKQFESMRCPLHLHVQAHEIFHLTIIVIIITSKLKCIQPCITHRAVDGVVETAAEED